MISIRCLRDFNNSYKRSKTKNKIKEAHSRGMQMFINWFEFGEFWVIPISMLWFLFPKDLFIYLFFLFSERWWFFNSVCNWVQLQPFLVISMIDIFYVSDVLLWRFMILTMSYIVRESEYLLLLCSWFRSGVLALSKKTRDRTEGKYFVWVDCEEGKWAWGVY